MLNVFLLMPRGGKWHGANLMSFLHRYDLHMRFQKREGVINLINLQ